MARPKRNKNKLSKSVKLRISHQKNSSSIIKYLNKFHNQINNSISQLLETEIQLTQLIEKLKGE